MTYHIGLLLWAVGPISEWPYESEDNDRSMFHNFQKSFRTSTIQSTPKSSLPDCYLFHFSAVFTLYEKSTKAQTNFCTCKQHYKAMPAEIAWEEPLSSNSSVHSQRQPSTTVGWPPSSHQTRCLQDLYKGGRAQNDNVLPICPFNSIVEGQPGGLGEEGD